MTQFALLGFYSLLAQTLLLREVSQVFGAHELALAGALAAWLLWTAAGVFIAARFARDGTRENASASPRLTFPCLALILLTPASILAARIFPALLAPGQRPGLFLMMAGPALLTLPAAMANGLAAGAALSRLPWRFYAAEAAGAALAGAFTVYYARTFPFISRILILSITGLLLPLAFYLARPRSLRRAAALVAALALLFGLCALEPGAWRLPRPAGKPDLVAETAGSRLVLTGRPGAESFYEDGRLLSAPGDTGPEELAHLPLLALAGPRRVLLTGSAAYFLLPEVLKHKPEAVDIAEPDHFKSSWLALKTRERPAGRPALKTEVTPVFSDLRGLKPAAPYDIIFLTSPGPDNAALNRDFTLESFSAAAARLSPGGLLVFQLPFPENYLPPEKAYTCASVLAAARLVFPSLTLLPGAKLTVIASGTPPDLDPARLAAVYGKRGIRNHTVVPSAFPFMLDQSRRDWAVRSLAGVKAPPDTDLAPVAYFAFWRSWLAMVVTPAALLGLAALLLLAFCCGLSLAGRLSFTPEERSGETFFMGFWAMALETSVLLAFQARTGRLAPELGALFAVFMAASAAGAALPLRNRFLPAVEAAAALLAGAGAAACAATTAGNTAWIWTLAAAGGALNGAFFRLAAGDKGSRTYGWDLLGGAAGGFITAAFSAPILGIKGSLFCAEAAALCALAGWFRGRLCYSSKAETVKE